VQAGMNGPTMKAPPQARCWGCHAPMNIQAVMHYVETPDGEYIGQPVPVFCAECRENGRADKLTPAPPTGVRA
jgi:uncharacterized OB-fold protein